MEFDIELSTYSKLLRIYGAYSPDKDPVLIKEEIHELLHKLEEEEKTL